MFPASVSRRRALLMSVALFALAACTADQTANTATTRPLSGDTPDGGGATVAMLLPFGLDENDQLLARNLENGARLALADFPGRNIELKIYNTFGTEAGAASAAEAAVANGADIILGPLRSRETAAAAPIAARAGINLLSFSNTTDIAGGNVFLLGRTHENAAERILSHAASQQRLTVFIVHAETPSGIASRRAIERALGSTGTILAGVGSYEPTQDGVVAAIPAIANSINETGSDVVLFTADAAGALAILAQLLPEGGVDTTQVKFAGLARWDQPESLLRFKGLQGGWFTLPDPNLEGGYSFKYRYEYGDPPHWISSLGYDGIAAIGTLLDSGKPDPFHAARLTSPEGFLGANGVFRFRSDGTNERALAIAEIRNFRAEIVSEAPRSFGFPGF